MFFNTSHGEVAELQGLYGPLQILEGKIQEVWALQRFQPGKWTTDSGSILQIRSPGRWNRGAGPDFREAVIEIDGEIRVGDIEIHVYREDWWRHGHHMDANYDRVILHVVLFAGGMERPVRTLSGNLLDEWVMGPWMREDLESISGGEPGLFGELVPELREWMESDSPEAIRDRLRIGADRRWEAKESMSRCLLDAAGWEGALHRLVLYTLGFPYNRRAFFEIAEQYPRQEWNDSGLPEVIKTRWERQVRWGLGRPANQAMVRLRQYQQLNHKAGDWASKLGMPLRFLLHTIHELSSSSNVTQLDTRSIRRNCRFNEWRKWLESTVLGGALSPSLAARLWIDAFLPMMVVGDKLPRESAFLLWAHCAASTHPDSYKDLLKLADIQIDRQLPMCNAWVQGMFWLEDQIRVEGVRRATG
ncbi:MAG: DUF2851 family protein [Puniceicoccaceae bacterium]